MIWVRDVGASPAATPIGATDLLTDFRVRRLDRMRRKPSKLKRRSPRAELEVTVSIGAAEAGGRGKPDDVIRLADRALYKAKEGGRNRVETS